MTCKNIVNVLQGITLEPMLLHYFITKAISKYATDNLLLQKACHPNSTLEPAYNATCPDEMEAQELLTIINSWRKILEFALPVPFIILSGIWSDTHGKRRRPLCFVPLLGEILSSVFTVFSAYVWSVSPQITAIFQAVFRGITGGPVLFSLAAFTYVSDITNIENRSWRLGIITSLILISDPVGAVFEGLLRSQVSFFNLFLFCTASNIKALFFGIFLMKNVAVEESKLNTFKDMLNPKQFILSVKTVLKKRPGNKRLMLWMSSYIAPFFAASFIGESAVSYLFLSNKFGMKEEEYSYYAAYKISIIFFGNIISTFICSKLLKWSDEVIGCLANVIQIITALGACFAAYRWQLYVFPLLDFMRAGICTAGRSITSKIVDGTELGQVNSVFGVLDLLVPIFVVPAYNSVYTLTIDYMSGGFYLLSVFLAMHTLVLFVAIYFLYKKESHDQSVNDIPLHNSIFISKNLEDTLK